MNYRASRKECRAWVVVQTCDESSDEQGSVHFQPSLAFTKITDRSGGQKGSASEKGGLQK